MRATTLLTTVLCLAAAPAAFAVSLKNFRELRAAFDVTFTAAPSPDFDRVWRASADRLPLRGQVEEMSSPAILAVTELAGAYCAQAIANDQKLEVGERTLFDEVDFTRGPEQFAPGVRDRLLNSLAAALWMRRLNAAELQQLAGMVDDLSAAKRDEVAATPAVLMATCATFATSLEFLKK